jgi:hypothetical protein
MFVMFQSPTFLKNRLESLITLLSLVTYYRKEPLQQFIQVEIVEKTLFQVDIKYEYVLIVYLT